MHPKHTGGKMNTDNAMTCYTLKGVAGAGASLTNTSGNNNTNNNTNLTTPTNGSNVTGAAGAADEVALKVEWDEQGETLIITSNGTIAVGTKIKLVFEEAKLALL